MKIRKAQQKDLQKILKLNLRLFRYEHKWHKTLNLKWTFGKQGLEYFKWRIKSTGGTILVAEDNNAIAGYLAGGIIERETFRTEKKIAEIENMFVEAKYQKAGIGSKLIEEFAKWCKKKKVDVIRTEVLSKNNKAQQFYKRLGFENHDVIMEKRLL